MDFSKPPPCIQIHPHPTKIPTPLENAAAYTGEEIEEKWLAQAGYRDMFGFMDTYGFDHTSQDFQATNFLRGFIDHPTREHPKWLYLVASEHNPSNDFDAVWLQKAGYGDMDRFVQFYGLKGEDLKAPAAILLSRFRAKHQLLWQEEIANVETGAINQWVSCQPPLVSVSVERHSGGFNMTPAQIKEVIQIHEDQGHIPYYDLKKLAQNGVLHSLPDFIGGMMVSDIPICDHCTKLGMKDR